MSEQGKFKNPANLAREYLKQYLREGHMPQVPPDLPPEFSEQAGVFVSLKKGGQLRGCIGTVQPVRDNLAEEIAANAISAAIRDPRFAPVSEEELGGLDVSVDVLSPMEKIESKNELDPKQYGVLVRSGSRSGLLLPDLEGVNTVDEQLEIAMRKAGIQSNETLQLFRFKVTRYGEK